MEKNERTKKQSKKMKPVTIRIGFFVVFVFCVGILLWYFFSSQSFVSPIAGLQPTPIPTPDVKLPKNVLLLGYGGGSHEGGQLTDTLIVARVIPKEKRIVLISLPRDMWVTMQVSDSENLSTKLNAAYAIGNDSVNYPNKGQKYLGNHGGGNLAKDAVSQISGMPIDAYVAISFSGFIEAMNLLGPVSVTVPFTFTDSFYPVEGKETESCGRSEEDIRSLTATMSGFELEKQFDCRYETLTFVKGQQTLDARTALKFVRSRHSDQYGNDFGRSQRQLALLKAVKESVFSLGTIPKIIPLLQKGFSMVDTDISFDFVKNALQVWGTVSDYSISSISLTDENILMAATTQDGQFILQPKAGANEWQSVSSFIQNEIASPSAATAKN